MHRLRDQGEGACCVTVNDGDLDNTDDKRTNPVGEATHNMNVQYVSSTHDLTAATPQQSARRPGMGQSERECLA